MTRPGPAGELTGARRPALSRGPIAEPRESTPNAFRGVASRAADVPETSGRAQPLASALVFAFLLAFSAGLAFHRVYGLRAIVPVIALAAAAPVVVSGLASTRRAKSLAPLWRSMLAQPVAWFAVAWGILYRDAAPGLGLGRRMGADLLDAPHRVLTTIAPVPHEGPLLILPFTVVWLAAYAGAELASRTRAVLTPALPALSALALAVVLGAGGPGSNVPATAGFAGAVGALVILRGSRASRPANRPTPVRGSQVPRARRVFVVSMPLILVYALSAAVFAPALSGAEGRAPLSPRDEAAAPSPGPISGGNPLALVGSWLADPERPMFHVRTSADSPADEARLADHDWRLAVLTRFDGTTWEPTASMLPTGGRVPADPERGDGGATGVGTLALDQHVTVQQLDGVWLPAADRAERVAGPIVADALAVDPDSGVLATRVPLRDGDAYRVESRVPVFDPSRVQYARPADDTAMTDLPEGPTRDLLRDLAQQATAGSGFPYQQALRLAQWLRDNYAYDVNAVPGHTYRTLEFFLNESRRGTSEQFATAFAAMARTLGLPTRVVVGFHHGTPDSDGWQVSGRDAVVWPEIEFEGVGWVPFHPTPGDAGGGRPVPTQATPVPGEAAPTGPPPGAAAQRQADDRQIIDARHDDAADHRAAPDATADGGDGSPAWWLWPLAVAVAAGLCYAGRRAHRALGPWRLRRGERRGDPARQIVAAWRHVGTHLHRLGMAAPETLAAEEVAAYGVARLGSGGGFGGEGGSGAGAASGARGAEGRAGAPEAPGDDAGVPAAALRLPEFAELVNGIAYGGVVPGPEQAVDAWRQADAVGRAARRAARASGRRTGRLAAPGRGPARNRGPTAVTDDGIDGVRPRGGGGTEAEEAAPWRPLGTLGGP